VPIGGSRDCVICRLVIDAPSIAGCRISAYASPAGSNPLIANP